MKQPQGAYYWMVDFDEKVGEDMHRKNIVFMKDTPEGYYLGCATPLAKAPAAKYQLPIAYAYEVSGCIHSDKNMPEIVPVTGCEVAPSPFPGETKVPLYAAPDLKVLYALSDIQRMTKDGRVDNADEIAYLVYGLLRETAGNEEIRVALRNIQRELLQAEKVDRDIRPSFIYEEATHALESTLQEQCKTAIQHEGKQMNVTHFKRIASVLLKSHYGIGLNDTHLWDDSVVTECINQGYRPYQVVAEHADQANLDRIDKSDYGVPSKAAITAADEAIQAQKLGLETAY